MKGKIDHYSHYLISSIVKFFSVHLISLMDKTQQSPYQIVACVMHSFDPAVTFICRFFNHPHQRTPLYLFFFFGKKEGERKTSERVLSGQFHRDPAQKEWVHGGPGNGPAEI